MDTTSKMPEPRSARWQPLRAGIQNLWEYDDQRFVFHGGRLLLRGRNESGKTKAIEVLLPFLLDADLSPQRLDPFGTTSRPMRWNLLNDNNPDVSLAIGYVWLELGRLDGNTIRTLTLGAGLRAKRAIDAVESWYFVTEQRIDSDLALLGEGRTPLTRGELEEAIGPAGSVFTKGQEYRRVVNARLFDLPEDQYEALVETLLQLRRPQLSKSLEPAGLSAILAASLPPLERGVLLPLADGFERLDTDRRQRESFATTSAAVDAFVEVYRRYAAVCAKARVQTLTQAESTYQRARAELRQCQTDRAAAGDLLANLGERGARLRAELDGLDARIDVLKSSDEYKSARELDDADKEAQRAGERGKRAAVELAADEERARRLEERRVAADLAVARAAERVAAAEAGATAVARDADLADEQAGVAAQAASGEVDAAQTILREVVNERRRRIHELEEHVRAVKHAEEAAEQAGKRLRDAEERVRGAKSRLETAERVVEAAVEGFDANVESWIDGATALEVSPTERARLLRTAVDDMEAVARDIAGAARSRLMDARRLAEARLAELDRELETNRAEYTALAAAGHQAPPAPGWRPERPAERAGAPFYMLCDFSEADPLRQAGLEAALEASGLLDAWVTPDGALLGPGTLDLLLHASPRNGRTLADVLVATEAGGVAAATVEAVLRTIELAGDDDPSSEYWVAADGRFRLGPLFGASTKDAPLYLGATARERERQRRLGELEARIAEISSAAETTRSGRDNLIQLQSQVDAAERAFPSFRDVLAARATVDAAATALGLEEQTRAEAAAASQAALATVRGAHAARDSAAVRAGLMRWLGRLAELHELTLAYREAADEALRHARTLGAERRAAIEHRTDAEEAQARCAQAKAGLVATRSEATRAAARAKALREASGASAERVLAQLAESEQRREAARAEARAGETEHAAAAAEVAKLAYAATVAEGAVTAGEAERRAGETGVKELASFGVLPLVAAGDLGDPAGWTYTDTLLAARRIDGAVGSVDASREAIDAAENKVSGRHQDLVHALPQDLRLQPERVDGFLRYRAVFNGALLGLVELAAALHAEVASRDRLMADEERKLFESFLSGEAHAHLGTRLRKAHALVAGMNDEIAARRTSSGMQIRLAWDITPAAPSGTKEAIELMLRSGDLLSDADRFALRTFLQTRLAEAKEDEAAGTFHERMLEVLDYRTWFAFTIEFKSGSTAWKPLTKKAHGAGSGGQKAVVLHLPLFAAAAAFYESASVLAPRLIILDEAFAGIDRPTRGQLMGLLVEFDLDFVMTSYDEWGFYEQLNGLSTYHLAREPGVRGVYSEWFVWDGKQSIEMGAS